MSIHPGIVYIVDDDEAFRDSVAWLLQTNGYQARLFPDAESFLKEVKPGVGGPPRCAVMDVRMPGLSGPQTQEALVERGIKLPLIFVTAHADVPIAVATINPLQYEPNNMTLESTESTTPNELGLIKSSGNLSAPPRQPLQSGSQRQMNTSQPASCKPVQSSL